MNKLREIFCPTPEQQQKQREQYKKLLEKAHEEKWCCTCKNYIPVDPNLPISGELISPQNPHLNLTIFPLLNIDSPLLKLV